MSRAYYYECTTCGRRMLTVASTTICPTCRSPLQNLGVTRE